MGKRDYPPHRERGRTPHKTHTKTILCTFMIWNFIGGRKNFLINNLNTIITARVKGHHAPCGAWGGTPHKNLE